MNTLDVQWGRYLSYTESRWSSHVDHTLPIRAAQVFRATPAARWRQYPGQSRVYGACHLMADLAVKSMELLAPGGWHPAPADLLRPNEDGQYDILVSALVAENEDHWAPELSRRARISADIARLALLPESATDLTPLVPFGPVLSFHRPGPGLSWFGVLHELRESVFTDPSFPTWIDYRTAAWRADSPVREILRDRLTLLLRFWQPPTTSFDLGQLLVSTTAQFDYLLAMRLHAHSLMVTHKPADRLTPANLQQYVEHYRPFIDWLLARQPGPPATASDRPVSIEVLRRNAFSVKFLAIYNTLITRNRQNPTTAQWNLFTPFQGFPSASVVDALQRLEEQAASGWPHLRAAFAEDWGDWLRDLPFFGTRPAESPVVNALRAATGALGPAWLTHEKDSTGRPGYPAFYGLVSLESWRNTSFRRDMVDWRRRLPELLKLMDRDPARLTDDERELVGCLWQEISGFLRGHDPHLPCDQDDADLLADWLRTQYVEHKIADVFLIPIDLGLFEIRGSGWQFTPPSVRWIAIRKLLLDVFESDVLSLEGHEITVSSTDDVEIVEALEQAGLTLDDDVDPVQVRESLAFQIELDSPAHQAVAGLVSSVVDVVDSVDAALAGADRSPLPALLSDLETYQSRRDNAETWHPRPPVPPADEAPPAISSTAELVTVPAVAEALGAFQAYVEAQAARRLDGWVIDDLFRLLASRLALLGQQANPLQAILCAPDGVPTALSAVEPWWVSTVHGPRRITQR